MGLYVAMVCFWLFGIVHTNYWRAATIVNVLFMLGLGIGRIISIIVDGIPSSIWLYGTVGELVIAAWGIFNLNHYKQKSAV